MREPVWGTIERMRISMEVVKDIREKQEGEKSVGKRGKDERVVR